MIIVRKSPFRIMIYKQKNRNLFYFLINISKIMEIKNRAKIKLFKKMKKILKVVEGNNYILFQIYYMKINSVIIIN